MQMMQINIITAKLIINHTLIFNLTGYALKLNKHIVIIKAVSSQTSPAS